MQLSATSTGLQQRGKGLAKIREVVARSPHGRLRLISRRGHYTYSEGEEVVSTADIPLLGTFLEIEVIFAGTGAKSH